MRQSRRTTAVAVAALFAVATAAACGGGKRTRVEDLVPGVDAVEVVAERDPPLPLAVVLIDRDGSLAMAAPPRSWTARLAGDPRAGSHRVASAAEVAERTRMLEVGMAFADLWDPGRSGVLTAVDVAPVVPPPLPPEPEPEPPDRDDDAQEEEIPDDEPGGTGTAMALDEGRMGKRDSQRASGQYAMKRVELDPQLARRQTIDQVHRSGILGEPGEGGPGVPPLIARVVRGGQLRPAPLLIAVHPSAPATRLIEVANQVRGYLAVAHRGKLRVLSVDLDGDRGGAFEPMPADQRTHHVDLELRRDVVQITAGVGPPARVGDGPDHRIDRSALTRTYREVRDRGELIDRSAVVVRVTDGVDCQRLVDLVVGLDLAGAHLVGLAPAAP